MKAELENLSDYAGLEDNRDSRWQVHLTWMLDHQPDLCRQLHQRKELGLWCDRNYQQALALVDQLQAKGATKDQAWDVAQSEIQAPEPPELEPANPLTPVERQQMQRLA